MTAWTSIGPAPLLDIYSPGVRDAGEVVSVAVDPRGATDDVIYVGTGHGGVWKTTDAGSTWHPLTDQMPSLSIGSVVLDAAIPDTVYAGTGNPMESNGGSSFRGYGIYRSTDAGQNWTILGHTLFGPSGSTPGALVFGMVSLSGCRAVRVPVGQRITGRAEPVRECRDARREWVPGPVQVDGPCSDMVNVPRRRPR
jgi:hypothetical protein